MFHLIFRDQPLNVQCIKWQFNFKALKKILKCYFYCLLFLKYHYNEIEKLFVIKL